MADEILEYLQTVSKASYDQFKKLRERNGSYMLTGLEKIVMDELEYVGDEVTYPFDALQRTLSYYLRYREKKPVKNAEIKYSDEEKHFILKIIAKAGLISYGTLKYLIKSNESADYYVALIRILVNTNLFFVCNFIDILNNYRQNSSLTLYDYPLLILNMLKHLIKSKGLASNYFAKTSQSEVETKYCLSVMVNELNGNVNSIVWGHIRIPINITLTSSYVSLGLKKLRVNPSTKAMHMDRVFYNFIIEQNFYFRYKKEFIPQPGPDIDEEKKFKKEEKVKREDKLIVIDDDDPVIKVEDYVNPNIKYEDMDVEIVNNVKLEGGLLNIPNNVREEKIGRAETIEEIFEGITSLCELIIKSYQDIGYENEAEIMKSLMNTLLSFDFRIPSYASPELQKQQRTLFIDFKSIFLNRFFENPASVNSYSEIIYKKIAIFNNRKHSEINENEQNIYLVKHQEELNKFEGYIQRLKDIIDKGTETYEIMEKLNIFLSELDRDKVDIPGVKYLISRLIRAVNTGEGQRVRAEQNEMMLLQYQQQIAVANQRLNSLDKVYKEKEREYMDLDGLYRGLKGDYTTMNLEFQNQMNQYRNLEQEHNSMKNVMRRHEEELKEKNIQMERHENIIAEKDEGIRNRDRTIQEKDYVISSLKNKIEIDEEQINQFKETINTDRTKVNAFISIIMEYFFTIYRVQTVATYQIFKEMYAKKRIDKDTYSQILSYIISEYQDKMSQTDTYFSHWANGDNLIKERIVSIFGDRVKEKVKYPDRVITEALKNIEKIINSGKFFLEENPVRINFDEVS